MTINIAGRWIKKEDAPETLPDEYSQGRVKQDWGLCIEFKNDNIKQERDLISEEMLKYYKNRDDINPKYHLTEADAFPSGYYLYAKNSDLLSDIDAEGEAWIQEIIYNLADALDAKFGAGYSSKNLLVEDQHFLPTPDEDITADAQITGNSDQGTVSYSDEHASDEPKRPKP